MLLQQRDVATVSAKHRIEHIPDHGDHTKTAVDRDVEEHPRNDEPRGTKRTSLANDVECHQCCNGVPNAWDETDQRIQTQSDLRSWNNERAVEQSRERIDPSDALGPRLRPRYVIR